MLPIQNYNGIFYKISCLLYNLKRLDIHDIEKAMMVNEKYFSFKVFLFLNPLPSSPFIIGHYSVTHVTFNISHFRLN